MIEIYGQGFSEKDRQGYVHVIHGNILSSIKTLLTQSDILDSRGIDGCLVSEEYMPSKGYIMDVKPNEVITPDMARHITCLWTDPGIQNTYENRSHFQLTDSAAYFFDKVAEVADPAYVPTTQDVLRSRVRTTGIVENRFQLDGNQFQMYDVGGQRNERKKWIHCFSDVTAVIFVAAMSAYDLVLFEDDQTNRMDEALTLFDEICNSRWFKKTSMILFLNKRDLFAEKIERVPLQVCFPEYEGGTTFEETSMYIKSKFESMNKQRNKHVYTHITCATDTDNMKHVFTAVKDIVIRQSLAEGGLLG